MRSLSLKCLAYHASAPSANKPSRARLDIGADQVAQHHDAFIREGRFRYGVCLTLGRNNPFFKNNDLFCIVVIRRASDLAPSGEEGREKSATGFDFLDRFVQ